MVNYIPEFQGYSGQGAFRYWCQKVLPLVYDDSLSYYELLNKVVVYLNNTIEDVAKAEGNIDSLLTAYTQLQGYVNDYFDNLDVQEEINTKLDAMAENGELTALISPLLPDLIATWLSEHITPTTPVVDDTLSVSGAAADSKTVGDIFKKTVDLQGVLSADVTPDNITDTGYYLSTQSYTETYCGISTRSVFFNLANSQGNPYLQMFILDNGNIYTRYQRTEDFTSYIKTTDLKAISYKATLTLNTENLLTPDTVTDTGYYISPNAVTEQYCGVSAQATFMHFNSGVSNPYLQVFILKDGRVFSRYGKTGSFKNGDSTSIAYRGTFSSELNPDNVNETGYYISPQSYTNTYCGSSTTAVFLNFKTGIGNNYVQTFILSNGKVYSRYGSTGDFKGGEETSSAGKMYYEASSNQVLDGARDSVGGMFKFYIPYAPDRHLRIYFIKAQYADYNGEGDTEYHNENMFRLSGAILGSFNSAGLFAADDWLISRGAWEGVYYKEGVGQAVGCFHGWEKFSSCIIMGDGEIIASFTPNSMSVPDINLTEVENIEIFQWSTISERPSVGQTTSAKLLDSFKHYIINKDGVYLKQKSKWWQAGEHRGYVGMANTYKLHSDKMICDKDDKVYDISNNNVTPYSDPENRNYGVFWAKEWWTGHDCSVSVKVDKPCWFHIDNTSVSAANKLYFLYKKKTVENEIWDNTAWYSFPASLPETKQDGFNEIDIVDKEFTLTYDSIINNRYINSTGSVSSSDDTNYTIYKYDVSKINGMDVNVITTLYGNSTYLGFADSNNNSLAVYKSSGQTGLYVYNDVLTVPSQAKYLNITFRKGSTATPVSVKIVNAFTKLVSGGGSSDSDVKCYYDISSNGVLPETEDSQNGHGGYIALYLPVSPDKYIKTYFMHGYRRDATYSDIQTDSQTNVRYLSSKFNENVFRLNLGYLGTISDNLFNSEGQMIVSGVWESVYYPEGRSQGLGTWYGWEKFDRIDIIVDGEQVMEFLNGEYTLTNTNLTAFDNMLIIYKGKLYRPALDGDGEHEGTTAQEETLIDITRIYTINKNGIHIEQNNVWYCSGSNQKERFGMGCVIADEDTNEFLSSPVIVQNKAISETGGSYTEVSNNDYDIYKFDVSNIIGLRVKIYSILTNASGSKYYITFTDENGDICLNGQNANAVYAASSATLKNFEVLCAVPSEAKNLNISYCKNHDGVSNPNECSVRKRTPMITDRIITDYDYNIYEVIGDTKIPISSEKENVGWVRIWSTNKDFVLEMKATKDNTFHLENYLKDRKYNKLYFISTFETTGSKTLETDFKFYAK